MSKATDAKRIKFNTELVECLAGVHNFEIEYIQPYHLRLSIFKKGIALLDYFPKSGKATVVASNRWITIPDIEKYINDLYA